jgi:tetratricopeptide (TPR) repeat protein
MLNWRAALLIISVGCAVYLNSFQGSFVFDEHHLLVNNPYIRHLWPPWAALFGTMDVDRPLIGLSNAINYAISGLNPWSYHALNLLIHILAALALFGIVRRTLSTGALAQRFGRNSTLLALAVALIWMVHPLQTQSVTYVVQRCESQMGMFYLLTLYCSIRGFNSRSSKWYAAAIAACAAGMLSKQIMVTAPLSVLLYDFLFAAGSIGKALRKRWPFYAGLAATWGILVATTMASPVNATAGFAVQSISPVDYFKSELGVIIHYLRLSIWPSPLCLDYYGWPKAQSLVAIAPSAILLGGLGAATVRALVRRKPMAIAGAWFFLIIGVTSSIMPYYDLVFEHRMYLPLASVVTLAVLGVYHLGERFLGRRSNWIERHPHLPRQTALGLVTIVVATLGFVTIRRNVDYHSPIVMWRDVVKKRPDNVRAHNNLGILLDGRGEVENAIAEYREALRIDPGFSEAHSNLGLALAEQGELDEGREQVIEALRLNPLTPGAHLNLARILAGQGEIEGAVQEYSRAVQIKPDFIEAYVEMGSVLENQGRVPEAKEYYSIGLQLRPDWPGLRDHIAELP